jgi:PKHD-type hydroxylase
MQNQEHSPGDSVVLRDRQFTEGRKNYFSVGPVCFDQEQLNKLKTILDEHPQQAQVCEAGVEHFTGGHYDHGRRTQLCALHPAEDSWVYNIIGRCWRSANELMRLEVSPSMNDPIQLLRYDEGEAGHFRWHSDTLPSDMTRKLTIVVPLSSPTEYEGGELQFNQGGVEITVKQTPGQPVAFPSWLIHQVTPVTRGRRYSLAAWIRGPNWR